MNLFYCQDHELCCGARIYFKIINEEFLLFFFYNPWLLCVNLAVVKRSIIIYIVFIYYTMYVVFGQIDEGYQSIRAVEIYREFLLSLCH